MGSSKQAEVLARALGGNVVVKNVIYNPLICLPNLVRPCGVGINFKKSDSLLSGVEAPDVIVSAGRRLAGATIFLRRYFESKFSRRVKIVTILNPNYNFRNFDLVILPLHDRVRHRIRDKNVLYINGSLCGPEIPVARSVRDHWEGGLESSRAPFFSLMIGGDTKGCRIDPVKLGLVVRKISNYTDDRGGTLLVSTSRRTSETCLREAKKWLRCDHHIYEWAENSTIPNPYYLFIEKSNLVFITGDSISMISEVIAMGRPSYVYMPDEFQGTKQENFCKNLFDTGMARRIDQSDSVVEEFVNNIAPNELENVSKFVKNNILGYAPTL
ncbi:MAG: mitochondrial fission ELM1 family protein [Rickettsiales bacterium]|nr:mitochondrial fission ELM1 family protein [Rickettsiales bacterium]